jgi:hypothetical protein
MTGIERVGCFSEKSSVTNEVEVVDVPSDPVVDVVEVYFSKSLPTSIHVIHYPFQSIQRPLQTIETKSRWKPKAELLEIESTAIQQTTVRNLTTSNSTLSYSQNIITPVVNSSELGKNEEEKEVDTVVPPDMDVNYSTGCHDGEMIERKRREMNDTKESPYTSRLMRMRTTSSSSSSSENDSYLSNVVVKRKFSSSHVHLGIPYCIGVMRDRRLYLVPVRGMFQMRPDFRYLDDEEEQQRKRLGGTSMDGLSEDEIIEAGNLDREETKSDNKSITTGLLQLQLVRRETERAEAARKRTHAHFQKQIEEEPWISMECLDPDSDVAACIYERLFGGTFAEQVFFHRTPGEYLDALISGHRTIKTGKSPPVPVTTWPLTELRRLPLTDRVIKLLSSAQVMTFQRLVNLIGLDTRDSSHLLTILEKVGILVQGTWTLQSEFVYHGYLASCRDYMLYLFRRQGYIERKSFADVVKLPHDQTKALLSTVAILYPDRKWRWKLDRDEEFLAHHTDFVMRFEDMTESRLKLGFRVLRLRETEIISSSNGSPSIECKRDVRDTTKSSLGLASLNFDSTTQSVVHPQTAGSARSYNPLSGGGGGSSIPETVESHLHRFIVQVLSHYGVVNRQLLHQQLAYHMTDPRFEILRHGISTEVLERQLRSLTEELHDVFVLRESDMPSYTEYRRIIIDLFRQKSDKTLKKSDIIGAIDKQLGKSLPNIAYSKIMKEIAIARGAQWTLKSGSGQETFP